MIQTLGRAAGDLGNPRVLTIRLQALAASVVVFTALGGLLVWVIAGFDVCDILGLGACPAGTAGGVIGALGVTLLSAWFLFPAVAIAVMTAFGDRLASAVEQSNYPDAASRARPIGVGRSLLMGLKSAARLLAFNLLAAPFYVVLLFTGVGPLVVFVVVNGIAFGRDMAELAAARHGDRSSRQAWLKATRRQQHVIGLAVSILFLVPFANLLAPVIGVAAAIHLFNGSYWTMPRVR